MRAFAIVALLVAITTIGGCENMNSTQKGAVIGGALGTGVGLVSGGTFGQVVGAGLIGGAAGAIVGAVSK
ncbi:MAG: hypothetical protein ACHQK9_13540 [Reyranellales bacterium]